MAGAPPSDSMLLTRLQNDAAEAANLDADFTAQRIIDASAAGPRPLSSCASAWTAPDVAAWVSEILHLPQYAEVFEVQQIDGPTLLELPEDLLETELHINNPIHRKKIIAHVKLLGAYIENLSPGSPVGAGRRPGERRSAPRSASSTPNWAAGPGAALRGRTWDDQSGGSENEDFLSSGGAASLQRESGASSNGGTGGLQGYSSASGSLLARKEHSMISSNFSGHGSALAERAAARRGRSMDRLAILHQTQAQRRVNSVSVEPGGSRPNSARLSQSSSIGGSSIRTSQSQRRGRNPDGKSMSLRGKRIDAWGELSPSCSRKGSFGKSPETMGFASRDTGPIPLPISPPKDITDPVTSYYYKASFERDQRGTVISPGVRKTLPELKTKSCSPGPAYRPKVGWSQLRVGGAIGGARRFAYDNPNCNHWLNEARED